MIRFFRKWVFFLFLVNIILFFITLHSATNFITYAKDAGEKNLREAFVNVAEKVGPAVVSISAEKIHRVPGRRFFYFGPRGRDFFDNDFFDEFFKEFFEAIPEHKYKQIGLGSGVIIDPEGYILTNEHVISGAEKIIVSLSDGREFQASIKGTDPRSDLAIIKIDAKEDLPYAVLGDSDTIKIGEWVVAIGNPFGFAMNSPKPTVTAGVISAVHRSLPGLPGARGRGRAYLDLLQTDAAINPGNSGGPLCNLDAEVIGINVAIVSTSGGYQGIGFAIPSNIAKRIIGDLIKGKEVVYGWIGVTIQEITKDLAEYFGLKEKRGVLISGVLTGGPAYKAGLKSGDIIMKIDDLDIRDIRDVLRKISQTTPGQKVNLYIIRNGKPMRVALIVGKRPKEPYAGLKVEAPKRAKEIQPIWRGIEVADITPDIAERLGIEDRKGVIITDVKPQSPGYKAGLRRGDVIRSINQIPIKGVADYNKLVKKLKGDALVRTDGGFVIVKEK